jgi:serine/threonine-protein kinase RsbT
MIDRARAEIRVRIVDDSDLVVARRHARQLATQQGLPGVAVESLAIAVTEVGRNMLVHAGGGEIVLAASVDATRCGVIVTALDAGPGILDVEQAMRDGFSTRDGLGLGLPSARRLVDEFEIESTAGAGTRVTLRTWRSTDSPSRA